MKTEFSLLAVALQFGFAQAYAQTNMANMSIESTDSLHKYSINYFSPGNGGKNKVWNFSKKLSSSESFQILFEKDSTETIIASDPTSISYYIVDEDKTFEIRRESSTEHRKYGTERLINVLPHEYGDSVSMPFSCEGIYCGNHPFRESGNTSVMVDAVGSLVLTKNDTIKNVTRVHTINSYSVCMDLDSASLDTAQLRQVIEERYEWYISDSQYPIIENITSTSYFNMDVLGTTKQAYFNIPESKAWYYINNDEDDEENDKDDSFEFDETHSDILHYNFAVRGGIIEITYDLDTAATINTIVASHSGITFRHKTWIQQAGQGYTTQIDCNGLSSGTYILYINVNGKVYSNKVTL